MANDQAGLELPIGLTEQKFLQQLARIEAKAIKSAQRSEQAFVKGNAQIGKSFTGMSGQARAGLQNVSYQMQDVIVQIQGGQGAARALSQQLPQLLSGFGVVGAAMGTVAAIGIPLAASFLSSGEEAKGLDEAVKELSSALDSYNEAVSAANVPTDELIEKYGLAAGAARQFLNELAQVARIDALTAVKTSGDAIEATFSDLPSILALVNAELEQFGEGSSGLETLADSLQDTFGLTIAQARELQGLLADRNTASTLDEQAAAMQRLSAFLNDAAAQAGFANAALNESAKAATSAALEVLEFKNTLSDGAVSAGDLASAVAGIDFTNPLAGARELSGALGVMVGQAQDLLNRLGEAAKAARQKIQTSVANGNPLDPLGAFGGGQSASGAVQVNAGGTIRTPIVPEIPKAAAGGRGGSAGGRSRGAGRTEAPLMENAERDITAMQRQLDLIGKSNEEVATAKARWELLDEVKRRGIPLNAELSAQIDAQAAQFGRLTGELERAEASQQQFEQAVDGIADAFAGALVAGESLREGLAQVFKQIASDILNSGIQNALSGAFGGGGFNPFALFGGGDALSGALRGAGLPARGFATGGYTGIGGMLEPAGVVHKGEYVFSKRAVDRMGKAELDMLHAAGMRGYATGGLVGDAAPHSYSGRETIIGATER